MLKNIAIDMAFPSMALRSPDARLINFPILAFFKSKEDIEDILAYMILIKEFRNKINI